MQHLGGVWVVAELLQTKCRAQANLQRIVQIKRTLGNRKGQRMNKGKGNHIHIISFTSIGSESLPPAETDVATLKIV